MNCHTEDQEGHSKNGQHQANTSLHDANEDVGYLSENVASAIVQLNGYCLADFPIYQYNVQMGTARKHVWDQIPEYKMTGDSACAYLV